MALFRVWPIRRQERTQWDPWREVEELRREMERVLERAGGPSPGVNAGELAFVPPADFYDSGGAFVVKFDLPDVRAEDVDISIEDGTLTVRGRRSAEQAPEESYLYRERPAGRFARTIGLPAGVEVDRVKATLRHGVLEILLPKSGVAPPRKVTIPVGTRE
jgi:HSP20 family protein